MTHKQAAVKVGRKKKWYKILASTTFNQVEIGELPLFEPEDALGRAVKVNLMILTHDPKKQDREVAFLINGRKDSFFTTTFKSFEITPASVKRLVKRGKSKIDDSFSCTTKDKKELTIKPVIVARSKINQSTRNDLRKECRSLIKENLAKLDYEQFLSLLITDKFQRDLLDVLKKIMPLSACKIRMMNLVAQKESAKKEIA